MFVMWKITNWSFSRTDHWAHETSAPISWTLNSTSSCFSLVIDKSISKSSWLDSTISTTSRKFSSSLFKSHSSWSMFSMFVITLSLWRFLLASSWLIESSIVCIVSISDMLFTYESVLSSRHTIRSFERARSTTWHCKSSHNVIFSFSTSTWLLDARAQSIIDQWMTTWFETISFTNDV